MNQTTEQNINELQVTVTPPAIHADFEKFKAQLTEQLAPYKIVVTEDTQKEAKRLATELNKMTAAIRATAKEQVAVAKDPIKAFESNVAELISMIQESREELILQTRKFEEERLKLVQKLIQEQLTALYDEHQVNNEFRKVVASSLVKLNAITPKNALTAKTLRELTAMVTDAKNKQGAVELRLVALAGVSYEAGLKTPLNKQDVLSFLSESDEIYQSCLDARIKRELERQQEIEAKLFKQSEEAKKAEQPKPVEPVAPPEPAPVIPEEPFVEVEAEQGTVVYKTEVSFLTQVPSGADVEAIEAQIRQLLGQAGISEIDSFSLKKVSK